MLPVTPMEMISSWSLLKPKLSAKMSLTSQAGLPLTMSPLLTAPHWQGHAAPMALTTQPTRLPSS